MFHTINLLKVFLYCLKLKLMCFGVPWERCREKVKRGDGEVNGGEEEKRGWKEKVKRREGKVKR